MPSQPQDVRVAQSVYHDMARDWPKESNKKVQPAATHHRLASLTPLQHWEAESVRDQPYHNIQAFRLMKGQGGFGEPSQRQGSSVGYIDPSEHKN
jgi:hypothetical protein